jgi:UDP:flavonoid glycosyltransferase YjiC (YdhE family)
VGTIWQCIEHSVSMLIIPGNIGDQYFNAERIQMLGLGVHLKESDLENDLLPIIHQCIESTQYQTYSNKSKANNNYTDTLVSACEKIENIHYLNKLI